MSKCSVKNCQLAIGKKFKFPDPLHNCERILKWLAACGNLDLLTLPPNKLKRRNVCSGHFEEKFILNQRLSKSAIPTLNLPEVIDAAEYRIRFQHELKEQIEKDPGPLTEGGSLNIEEVGSLPADPRFDSVVQQDMDSECESCEVSLDDTSAIHTATLQEEGCSSNRRKVPMEFYWTLD